MDGCSGLLSFHNKLPPATRPSFFISFLRRLTPWLSSHGMSSLLFKHVRYADSQDLEIRIWRCAMTNRRLMAAIAISVPIFVCPAGHAAMPSEPTSAEHTPREKGCGDSRADKKCGKEAEQCFYKFTVNELVDQKNLKVTYPSSVWEVTMETEKSKPEEINYRKEYEKYPYSLRLTAESAIPTEGKTYIFTRCPDNDFTLGVEIGPDDQTFSNAQNQKQSKP